MAQKKSTKEEVVTEAKAEDAPKSEPRKATRISGIVVVFGLLIALFAIFLVADPATLKSLLGTGAASQTEETADIAEEETPAEDIPVVEAEDTTYKEAVAEHSDEAFEVAPEEISENAEMSHDAIAEPAADTRQLERRIASMEAKISGMSQELNELRAIRKEYSELMEATMQLAEQAGSDTAPQDNVLVRLYQLEKQALAGQPFKDVLDDLLLDAHLPPDAHRKLQRLRYVAMDGVIAEKDFTPAFEQAMETYLSGQAPASAAGKEAGTWETVKRNLSSLVTVRKVGSGHTGKDDASIIARAEAHMADGYYNEAYGELETLSDDTRAYFEPWMTRMDERRMVSKSIDQVRSLVSEGGR